MPRLYRDLAADFASRRSNCVTYFNPAVRCHIRNQRKAKHVTFFFKQWGGVQKKCAARQLQGRTWDEMPEC